MGKGLWDGKMERNQSPRIGCSDQTLSFEWVGHPGTTPGADSKLLGDIIGPMAAPIEVFSASGSDAPDSGASLEVSPETVLRMAALKKRLLALGRVMVAYSGGVDSAFLAATAHEVLDSAMLAVLADSPSLSRHDLELASSFAASQKIPLRIVQLHELSNPEYARNDADRCFHCKSELFTAMKALGTELGFAQIAYGMNADDRMDYRPGQRAAEEQNVLAPLAEAGLSKAEIRLLSRAAGYPLWDRPAAPCLASRVEYGRPVTREVLAQIEAGETSLRQMGFRELRVRHHGELARVEIARAELSHALTLETLDAITIALKAAGFKYVTLDCSGFRSGSLNDLLPAEILARKGA